MTSLKTAAVVLLGLVGLASVAIWKSIDPGPPAPTDEEWQAAAELIGSEWKDGDGLRVHPFWLRESAAKLAGDLVDGEPPRDMDLSLPADSMFEVNHRRIWVVTAMGRQDDVPGLVYGHELELDKEVAPGLVVRRYRMTASPLVVDLREVLADAKVTRAGRRGNARPCRWKNKQHDCQGRSWENVAVGVHEVAGSPRRCFLLHPFPDGGKVTITWKDLELGAGVLIRAGLTIDAARNEKGSDAKVTVSVDGKRSAAWTIPKHSWEHHSRWIPTRASRGDLSISVTASQEDFRDVCVDGFTLASPPPMEDD